MARSPFTMLPLFLLALPASAAAQDFGTEWTDRITHMILDDSSPLQASPLTLQFSVGEVYSYDSNIFLTDTKETNDSIFTTFGQVILKYAEVNWDAEADLMINYNAYADTSDASTDEERFFGRIRGHGATSTLQLTELARRESSPTDAVFAHRAARFVSDTIPEAVFRLSDTLWVEGTSTIEYVTYRNENFQTADNINSRSIGTLAYRTKRTGMDVLVQGGYLTIHYQDFDAPPDAYGWIARVGVRGDAAPDLHVSAVAGATHVASTNSSQIGRADPMTTMDAEFHLVYNLTDIFTLYADYSRRPGFSSGTSAYQIVGSADVILEYTPRDDLTLRARAQHDRVHTSDGERRAYFTTTVGPEYRILERLHVEAHATYRVGVAPDTGGAGSFNDLIFSAGIVGTF